LASWIFNIFIFIFILFLFFFWGFASLWFTGPVQQDFKKSDSLCNLAKSPTSIGLIDSPKLVKISTINWPNRDGQNEPNQCHPFPHSEAQISQISAVNWSNK
jgi:hypothetical protein